MESISKKTKMMVFSRKERSHHKQGEKLEQVTNCTYLGHTLRGDERYETGEKKRGMSSHTFSTMKTMPL